MTFYARVREFADATIAALPVDAPGVVTWWSPGRREVTLREVPIELHRHAGHRARLEEIAAAAGRALRG